MEESLITYLKEQFHQGEVDIRTYSPLTLAYIGDAIYDLLIRTLLVDQGNRQVNKLHKTASSLVNAKCQSGMIETLASYFTVEEETVFKRGRNAKSFTSARNASIADYRRATGFEAVMGHLYLTGQYHRIIDLIKLGLAPGEEEKEKDGKRTERSLHGK